MITTNRKFDITYATQILSQNLNSMVKIIIYLIHFVVLYINILRFLFITSRDTRSTQGWKLK